MPFLKGHGTENDFVIIPDHQNTLDLPPAVVARICDRRAGVGGDGLLRVVRSEAHPEARAMAPDAEWFMDYRNSDGSVAEMCGNGVRVFARHLGAAGLVEGGDLRIATRAGVREVHLPKDPAEGVTVTMGRPRLSGAEVTVTVGERSWPAVQVDMGNPHAVVFVDDLAEAGPLRDAPALSPAQAYPEGANVEFVVVGKDPASRQVALRVHERGSGETRSCGTGACAVMVAAARRAGAEPVRDGTPVSYRVDVPGGTLRVSERVDGQIEMTGPAVIVAQGVLDAGWLAADQ